MITQDASKVSATLHVENVESVWKDTSNQHLAITMKDGERDSLSLTLHIPVYAVGAIKTALDAALNTDGSKKKHGVSIR